MKLRNGVLAAATALTLVAAGTASANAQQGSSDLLNNLSSSATDSTETTTAAATPTTNATADEADTADDADTAAVETDESVEQPTNTAGQSSSNGKSKDIADEIKTWLGVATAIIAFLGTLFSFVSKNIAPLIK